MIKAPILIKKKKYFDKRGFFQEIYLLNHLKTRMIFSAVAYSKKNVIRGLHFQTKKKQTKMIHVIKGKILDVIINLNIKSKKFGKISKYILQQGDILVVPNNYAHGYECLSKECIVLYHLDNYRDINSENGILYNDKELNIKWFSKKPIISKRDKFASSFKQFKQKIKTL